MIRQLTIFPQELIMRFNDGLDYSNPELSLLLGGESQIIVDQLDEKAKTAIRTVALMEYARCKATMSNAM